MSHILEILPTLNVCGGVENYLMNYYTHMELLDIKIDFCVHSIEDDHFKNIIEEKGGKIFLLPPFHLKNYKTIKKEVQKLFLNNKYDIVHCHQANAAYLYFKYAKKNGVKYRILHSHQASAADKFWHKVRNKPLLWLGVKRATEYFACSELAGKYLYRKKPFIIINNAIDIEKFKFNSSIREEVRKELGIEDNELVIGHIGRFCRQKNQSFLIDIFQTVQRKKNNIKLFLVGGGELEMEYRNKVHRLNLEDKITFLGIRTDTYRLYQAMDVLVMPSLYEGLPVVGIEAQCSGLSLILSNEITQETAILNSTKFVRLDDEKEWESAIISAQSIDRNLASGLMREAGYDINIEAKKLREIYLGLVD